MRRLLAEGRLRPSFLFEAVPTRVVTGPSLADADPTFQTLRNLNTPEDYEAALRDPGGGRGLIISRRPAPNTISPRFTPPPAGSP